MSEHTVLWILFGHLCAAFALVVLGAHLRARPAGDSVARPTRLVECADPLWGKSQPVEAMYFGVVGIDPDALRESQARWPKAPTVADLMKDEW